MQYVYMCIYVAMVTVGSVVCGERERETRGALEEPQCRRADDDRVWWLLWRSGFLSYPFFLALSEIPWLRAGTYSLIQPCNVLVDTRGCVF